MTVRKPRAYISGVLSPLSEENRVIQRQFYEAIGRCCELAGLEPYIPHQHSDPIKDAHLTFTQVNRRDKQRVTESQLVICYVGRPSCGAGGEAQLSESLKIPLILLHEDNLPQERAISRYTLGSENVIRTITGASLDQLVHKLSEELAYLVRTFVRTPSP